MANRRDPMSKLAIDWCRDLPRVFTLERHRIWPGGPTRKGNVTLSSTHAIRPTADRTATRQRILARSLALFNERGPSRVTTAEIAEAAGIAEGNLQYHFKKKSDLLAALFDMFEVDADILVSRRYGDDGRVEEFAEHQRCWFRLMWTHQWFYRGTSSLLVIAPALLPRVRAMTVRNRQFVTSVFERMVECGLLRTSPEQLEQVLSNIWIVATHWIDYRRFTTGRTEFGQEDLEWGYAQVLAIYAPYLTKRGQVLHQGGMASHRPTP